MCVAHVGWEGRRDGGSRDAISGIRTRVVSIRLSGYGSVTPQSPVGYPGVSPDSADNTDRFLGVS